MLEATTTATTLSADTVGRDGRNVFDATNLHAGTGEGTEGTLGTGTGGFGAVATGCADLDMEGGDTELLAFDSNVLGGQHGSVRGRLVTVSTNLHAAGDTDDRLASGQVSNVNKGVVEGGKDVGNPKNILTGTGTRGKGDIFLGFGLSDFLRKGD